MSKKQGRLLKVKSCRIVSEFPTQQPNGKRRKARSARKRAKGSSEAELTLLVFPDPDGNPIEVTGCGDNTGEMVAIDRAMRNALEVFFGTRGNAVSLSDDAFSLIDYSIGPQESPASIHSDALARVEYRSSQRSEPFVGIGSSPKTLDAIVMAMAQVFAAYLEASLPAKASRRLRSQRPRA